jgi:hypothetical protein
MKLTVATCALAALAVAGCAGTPSGATSQGPSVEAVPGAALQGATLSGPIAVANTADSGADEEICRKMDPYTGSRVGGRKVCMTKAEWDERERAAKEFAKDAATNGKWNLDKGD